VSTMNTKFHEILICTQVIWGTDTHRHGHTLYFPEQSSTFPNSIALPAMGHSLSLNYKTLCPLKLHNHYQLVNSPHTNHRMHIILKLHFCLSKCIVGEKSLYPYANENKMPQCPSFKSFSWITFVTGKPAELWLWPTQAVTPLTNGWCVKIWLNEMSNSVDFAKWYHDF
jgi:hypothetical protein